MTFCYENEANEFIRMREADKMSYEAEKSASFSELFEKLVNYRLSCSERKAQTD